MSAYRGTENLAVLAEAVNYNAFLRDLVMKFRAQARRVVDFGAGIGTFAAMLRARGVNVTCVEPDAAQRALIRREGLEAVASLDEMPDASIDYIYSLNVLEHIADDAAALRAIASKLAIDGRLLLYVPAFQMLFSSMDRKVGHHRRYRRAQLVALARSAGLEVLTCRYADSLGFPATLAYKAIGSRSGDIDRRALMLFDRFVFPVSRAVDRAVDRIVGKNLYLVAHKAPRDSIAQTTREA
jgi:SAM-dependent methyltransferase